MLVNITVRKTVKYNGKAYIILTLSRLHKLSVVSVVYCQVEVSASG
jgi:hypothetical protein